MQPVTLLSLPVRLDSSTVSGLVQSLLSLRGRDLDLCGMNVERVGGQGLQVVLSAFETWSADGQRLRIVDPSVALCRGLEMLGFPFGEPAPEEVFP